MKPVKLYDTLSRSVKEVQPIEPGHVKLYCCGPTVYNYQHIGNLRAYIFEDILARALRYAGYKVTHCMNITDVGHLVSDADEGEDKMLVAKKREGKTSHEIAEFYSNIFFQHCKALNITKPNVVCKATEHVPQMIALCKRLEERGYAYFAGGNLYFDVSKLSDYGKLAKLDLCNLQAGARIEVDQNKRNPLDFVLWFTNSKFENQELQWDSPWGVGYPGWHIECSAMSMHYLGDSFDIHCGGIDHIPVHHTNEIAQSEGATGKTMANIWMHGAFLVIGKDKMAKSAGGFVTLDSVTDKNIDATSYRVLCLSATYRTELAWSWEGIENAQNSLNKLKNTVIELKKQTTDNAIISVEISSANMASFVAEFDDAVLNDLNMPKAMAVLHKTLSDTALKVEEKLRLLYLYDQVLGLGIESWKEELVEVPNEITEMLHQREAARKNKNWAEADRLRDEILRLGFVIEDSKDGAKAKPKR